MSGSDLARGRRGRAGRDRTHTYAHCLRAKGYSRLPQVTVTAWPRARFG